MCQWFHSGMVELKYNVKNARCAQIETPFENTSLTQPESKPDFWAGITPNHDFDNEQLPF
jgi:hypothetical protein